MNILQEALVALLSGLTTKTGNEIHWKDECENNITIEPTDIEQCKYIIRYYHKDGTKRYQGEYQNNKKNGVCIAWYLRGNQWYEAKYRNGILHNYTEWYGKWNYKNRKDIKMALALVKLTKKRGNKIYEFFDYISADVAKLGVDIQGQEHGRNEWSRARIVKIYGKQK